MCYLLTLTYGALIVPTLLVGIGTTVWGGAAVFPVFSVFAAALCLTALVVDRVLAAPGKLAVTL